MFKEEKEMEIRVGSRKEEGGEQMGEGRRGRDDGVWGGRWWDFRRTKRSKLPILNYALLRKAG